MTSPPNKYVGYTKQTFKISSAAYTYVFNEGVNPNYYFFVAHDNSPGVFSNVSNVALQVGSYIHGGTGNGDGTAGAGVDLTQTATVENTSAGHIIGGYNYNGFVNNALVKGTGGIGVSMVGGELTNDKGGTIRGGGLEMSGTGIAGIGVSLAGGTLSNSGGIYGGTAFSTFPGGPHGSGGDGVDLSGGAALTNTSTGVIDGSLGLYAGGIGINASGTGTVLVNAGHIAGGGVYSDADHGFSNDTASGGAGVMLSGGATLTNSGNITSGASATGASGIPAPAVVVASGGKLVNDDSGTAGTVTVAAGGTVINSGNLGAVDLNGGTLTTSPNHTSGDLSIVHGVDIDGGTLTTSSYIGGLTGGADIQFGTLAGTVKIETGATFGANGVPTVPNIDGFAAGDVIDITYLSPATVKSDFNTSTHTLSNLPMGTLEFGGSFSGETFTFNSDGATGTDITLEPACYLRGTRILSSRGEIAIENLRIGDAVITMTGVARPVRWIGRRRYSRAQAAADPLLMPVRIAAGALADGVPRRDLWVSPEHALFIDDMLIPASALINGASITRESALHEVTYLHLEFDSHAVILAEGAAAESFVDDESRGMFDNAHEFGELYPAHVPKPARSCAPRIEEGAELEQVRGRLARRAGIAIARATEGLRPKNPLHEAV
jgi:hypothetical protein